MLDLVTKEWTDQFGITTPIKELRDNHLFNIQKFLSRRIKDKQNYIANRQSYWENMACAYEAEYGEKDWYCGSAFTDVEEAGEEDYNRLKVALMLISQEVRRRSINNRIACWCP